MTLVLSGAAAVDRTLLTLSEAKAALSISGNDEDATISTLVARVSDQIARACGVPMAGISPPTLRSESVTETLFVGERRTTFYLARRFVSEVSEIEECGSALEDGDYSLNASVGGLTRLHSGRTIWWPTSSAVIVNYTAGFEVVPDDLKLAAAMALQDAWAVAAADPLVKRERVEGVSEQEYFFVANTGALSQRVRDVLAPFCAWPTY